MQTETIGQLCGLCDAPCCCLFLQLVDVFLIHEDLNLVFEYCETDLESILMEQSVILKPEHIKCHMRMLLDGIGYLHNNFVLHRVRISTYCSTAYPKIRSINTATRQSTGRRATFFVAASYAVVAPD